MGVIGDWGVFGILAAIALPMYQDYTGRAQAMEAVTLADGVRKEVSMVYAESNSCPTNGTGAIGAPDIISGKFVKSVTAGGSANNTGTGGCTVMATFKSSGVNPKLSGKTVTWTLSQTANKIEWTCNTTVTDNGMKKALQCA